MHYLLVKDRSCRTEIGAALFSLENPDYLHVRTKHFVMSSVQIAMLLTMIWLSVFKPWKSGGSAKKPSGDL